MLLPLQAHADGRRSLLRERPRGCRWFIAIARAIKYLHACRPSIIHRDIKPENVLLTARDASTAEAKLIDLGLHMRGRSRSGARVLQPGDREGSYYGGNNYDAALLNGSVYAGNAGALRAFAAHVCACALRFVQRGDWGERRPNVSSPFDPCQVGSDLSDREVTSK